MTATLLDKALEAIRKENERTMALPTPAGAASSTPGTPRQGANPAAVGLPGMGGARKIKLNHTLDGVESSGLVPVGRYPGFVTTVEETASNNGNQVLIFRVVFDTPEGDALRGRKDQARVTVTENAMWAVKNAFDAIGLAPQDEITPDSVKGRRVILNVTHREWDGITRNNIVMEPWPDEIGAIHPSFR